MLELSPPSLCDVVSVFTTESPFASPSISFANDVAPDPNNGITILGSSLLDPTDVPFVPVVPVPNGELDDNVDPNPDPNPPLVPNADPDEPFANAPKPDNVSFPVPNTGFFVPEPNTGVSLFSTLLLEGEVRVLVLASCADCLSVKEKDPGFVLDNPKEKAEPDAPEDDVFESNFFRAANPPNADDPNPPAAVLPVFLSLVAVTAKLTPAKGFVLAFVVPLSISLASALDEDDEGI